MVASVFEMTGLGLADIEAVAVDVGPGLFTGIRVGVAAAKGYAMALGIPVVGLTSLQILAAAASSGTVTTGQTDGDAGGRDEAVAVVDLRRGEVAWRLPPDGPSADAVVDHGKPEALVAVLLERYGNGPVVVAGDGAIRYADLLRAEVRSLQVAGREFSSAPVASLAMQALDELAAGRATTATGVTPVYLRDADVRINWSTRHDSPRHDSLRQDSPTRAGAG
jgi:tRNA threonylcarbamoyladenosine biosynthesis protein TsaB